MEETIQKLYNRIRDIGAWYLIYRIHDNIEQTKEIVPEIQEFVLWFLDGNRFGLEDELYQNLCRNLVDILKDILDAMDQGDIVLLHDAMAYGLIEYLQLFIDMEQEDEMNDKV